MSALDDKIDDLYQQPLGEFISARNTLAKTLSGADAARVKGLPKPTVVAWAANQVYWQARSAHDALMKSGERVRKAQIAALQGKAADIRTANEEHRRAVAAAVGEAERLASKGGSKPSPDALSRTFEALSLTPHPPDPPGRLAEPLQPASGFEALAGITPAGPASVRRQPDRDHGRKETAGEREAARRAEEDARAEEAKARKRESELKKAEAAVARAEATEKLARASWEEAHDALLEARRQRDDIKKSIA